MVLYPLKDPHPVLRPPFRKAPAFVNRRAETLRRPSPSYPTYQDTMEEEMAARGPRFEYRPATPGPKGRRRGSRKSPSRRPHRKVPYFYPSSPQYKPPSSEEEEGEDTHKGGITDPTPTPRPQDWSSDDEVPDLVNDKGESDNQVYSTPPETAANTPLNLQQQHTALSKKLDEALEEALNDNPLPSTSTGRQGGGDREVPPPPGYKAVPRAPLNLAEERWYLEPNKVQYLDAPDTYRANEGRHRIAPLKLLRAKTFPHLVFADSPASPDREEDAQKPNQKRAATSPP